MLYTKGKEKYKKFNVWCVLLFVPLTTFITPIKSITFGDALLFIDVIALVFAIIIYKIKFDKIVANVFICFIFFIIMHSLVNFVLADFSLSDMIGLYRYLLHMLVVILGARFFVNKNYFFSVYTKLALIFAVYAVLQYGLFNLTSIILPTNIFNLPTHDYIIELSSPEMVEYYTTGRLMYRPRSIFIEPSYYAVYQIPILYYIINISDRKQFQRYLIGVFISLSILAVGAATGIVLLVLCWIKPILIHMKKISTYTIGICIAIILGIVALSKSAYLIENVIVRIIGTNGQLGSALLGRIGNLSMFFDGSVPFVNLIFGYGMVVDSEFLPSIGAIIFKFGIVGLFIFMFIMLITFFKCGKIGKEMMMLLAVMCMGTNPVFEVTSVLMFTIIYSDFSLGSKKRSMF